MKTMKRLLLLCFLLLSIELSAQQQVAEPVAYDKLSLGLGLGMDYGGIGGQLLIYPQRNIGIFGGVGYAFAGVGYNVGAKIRLVSDKSKGRIVPFLLGMYGYNAAIAVSNMTSLNKMFYGPTFGIGLDFRGTRKSYWSLGLLIPVRGAEVQDYIDMLKTDYGAEFKNDLLPIGITIGYHIALN
jgi:hypothetical protein